MPTINDKIKNLRELKNLTQSYVAKELGMTQAGYSKIETGETDVSFSKLQDLAGIFNIPVEELITFDSRKFFNSFNNLKGSNNGSITINVENKELEKLYKDKIRLLEQILRKTEVELAEYKEKFGFV